MQQSLRYQVNHDGSKASIDSLSLVRWSLYKKGDHIVVAHAFSVEKEEYLPYNLKMNTIRQLAEAECIQLGNDYLHQDLEIVDGHTAKEVLNQTAQEQEIDLMVVGFHGRKGPKDDPTVMGSAVQFLALNSAAPVLILKDPIPRVQKPDGFNFCALIDGSERSMKGLDLLCRMRQKQDRITIIMCEQDSISIKKIKDKVEYELEERDCLEQTTIEILSSEPNRRTADVIRDWIMQFMVGPRYVDVIFLGNKGADFFQQDTSKYLGSVANEIIRNTKLNVVFIV